MPLPQGVSIVVPAWNDGSRLLKSLGIYLPRLESCGVEYEVIVVSDGSAPPETEIRSLGSRHVKVVHFPSRLGKGGAIIAGLLRARYAKAGFVDADGPVSPDELMLLIRELDHADGVVAIRGPDRGPREARRPLLRRMLSATWNGCARGLLLTHVRDTQCGAKFFCTEKMREVLPEIVVRDWAFDLDLLHHWERRGFSLRQVPVNRIHDQDSRLGLGRAVPAMAVALLGLRLYYSPVRRLLPRNRARDAYDALGSLANGFGLVAAQSEPTFEMTTDQSTVDRAGPTAGLGASAPQRLRPSQPELSAHPEPGLTVWK